MSTRRPIIALFVILMTLAPGAVASAQEAGDPFVRLDSQSKTELDLSVMVDDLMPRLSAILAEEDPESAEALLLFVELLGVDALQYLESETKQTRDRSTCKFELTLDPNRSETVLYRLLTTPNGKCDFARYVNRDELVGFVTIHNFPHYLEILLDFLGSTEMVALSEGQIPVDDAGNLALGPFVPRTDLLPLLSGEFDFFILEQGEEAAANPMIQPYFMVLGATDGFALRDRIVEIAGMLGGGDIGGMLDAVEPEMVGAFELKVLPMGGALAVSPEYLVIGMDPDRMRSMLAARSGDLKVPDGIEWAYIDGPRYGAHMESLMGMMAMMGGEDAAEIAWMMEMYEVLFEHMEYEEILYRSTKTGMKGEVEVRGPMTTGVYRMAIDLLDKLPLLMAMEREKEAGNAYGQAIMLMDEAMMAWAADHEGTYPADPTLLLEEGYLEEWPFVAENPAGVFGDWCYTYHPYVDAEGTVVGYIFFLYGDEPGTGHDVYTEENVAAEGPFAPAADGMPDGVASFCYDGTALEIIEGYYGR